MSDAKQTEQRLLRISDVVEGDQVSRSTVNRLIKNGTLEVRYIGRAVRITGQSHARMRAMKATTTRS